MEEASLPLIENFELKSILDEFFDKYVTEENLNKKELDDILEFLKAICMKQARLDYTNELLIKRSINIQTILRTHKNITTDFKHPGKKRSFVSVNEYYDAFLENLSLKDLSKNHKVRIISIEKQKLAS